MMYLIGQLAVFLLLTAAAAGFAGWVFAAHRAAPAEAAARRERNRLMRDLINMGVEDSAPANGVSDELEREMDRLRRRAELDGARVSELEGAVATARAQADHATSHAAELQRALDRVDTDSGELTRLREVAALNEQERSREIEAVAEPVVDDDATLNAWRLRYFEQRVNYLEGNAREAQPVVDTGALEQRAHAAETRVAELEEAARNTPAPVEASPFAADAEVDVLMRWRMLYLERRVAYLQEEAGAVVAEPAPLASPVDDAAPDPDRWKWRARYLEARVRHLEDRLEDALTTPTPAPPAPAPASEPVALAAPVAPPPPEPAPETPAPLVPPGSEKRPDVIVAARNGAPDDFTLIEGVTSLQQSMLNALGVFHFDQIAAWSPANVAWVDKYFRLRGRIVEEEWVEQAADLARDGVHAARRSMEEEEA